MTTQYVDGETMRVYTSRDQFSPTYSWWPDRLAGEPIKYDARGAYRIDPATSEPVYAEQRPKAKQTLIITPGATLDGLGAGVRLLKSFLSADPKGAPRLYAEVTMAAPEKAPGGEGEPK